MHQADYSRRKVLEAVHQACNQNAHRGVPMQSKFHSVNELAHAALTRNLNATQGETKKAPGFKGI